MLSFSAVIEPLRMANRLAGCDLYQWDIYGFEDKEVSASNGVSFSPTQSINNIAHLDLLLVVAGIGALNTGNPHGCGVEKSPSM